MRLCVSTPLHATGMYTQPASLYFQSVNLYASNDYISYEMFLQRIQTIVSTSGYSVNNRTDIQHRHVFPVHFIHVAVYFEWDKQYAGSG